MFSFEKLATEARPVEEKGRRALAELLTADREYQEQVCAAGGEITSRLTDEGEEAADRIMGDTRRQLDAVYRPRLEEMDKEHRRRVEDILASADPLASKYRDLRAFEDEMETFLLKAKLPRRRRVIDGGELGLHLHALSNRARQLVQPPPAARAAAAPRPTPPRPDFSSLLRRVLGRA